jgi:uncharacterized protein YifE (UPF0438 family)
MAKLSAEEARNRFGLVYNDKHASGGGSLSDGAMYVNGDYIGSMEGTTMEQQQSGPDIEAQGIGKYKAIQDYAIENNLGGERAEWNSYNDVQGALEDVYGAKSAPQAAPEENLPIKLSERAAQAKAYTAAYEDKFLPRQGDYTIRNDQSVLTDFNDQFKLNLAKERAPQQPAEPAALVDAEAEYDPQKAAAKNYSKNYKLAVGDMLSPKNR